MRLTTHKLESICTFPYLTKFASSPGASRQQEGVLGRCALVSDWFFSQWECHWCRKFMTRCPLRWSRVAIKGCDVEMTEGEKAKGYNCTRMNVSRMNVSENKGEYNCSYCDWNNFLCRKRKRLWQILETRQIRIRNWELNCERNKNARRGNRTHVLDVTGSENLKGRVAHNRAPNHAPCLVAHILDSGQASSGRYFCCNTLFRPFPESVQPSE